MQDVWTVGISAFCILNVPNTHITFCDVVIVHRNVIWKTGFPNDIFMHNGNAAAAACLFGTFKIQNAETQGLASSKNSTKNNKNLYWIRCGIVL